MSKEVAQLASDLDKMPSGEAIIERLLSDPGALNNLVHQLVLLLNFSGHRRWNGYASRRSNRGCNQHAQFFFAAELRGQYHQPDGHDLPAYGELDGTQSGAHHRQGNRHDRGEPSGGLG